MQQYGIVYVATNLINKKQYVGQTTSVNPEKYFQEHLKNAIKGKNKYFYKAIRRYGTINFIFEIIYHAFDKEELDRSEDYFISEFNSIAKHNESGGYNLKTGGANGKMNKLTKEKLSKSISNAWKNSENGYFDEDLVKKRNNQLKLTSSKAGLAGSKILHRNKNSEGKSLNAIKAGLASRSKMTKEEMSELGRRAAKGAWLIRTTEEASAIGRKGGLAGGRKGGLAAHKKMTKEEKKRFAQTGAYAANHKHWHVKRNIVSPTCTLCQSAAALPGA